MARRPYRGSMFVARYNHRGIRSCVLRELGCEDQANLVHRDMQLPPTSATSTTPLRGSPLPFPEKTHSRRIDHDMDRPAQRPTIERHLQLTRSTRQRRVVRDVQLEPHQRDHRSQQPFRLPPRKPEHQTNRERRLDRHVRVPALTSGSTGGQRGPRRDRCRCQPERDVAPVSERSVVLRPVRDPVPRLVLRMDLRSTSAHQALLDPEPATSSDFEPCTNAIPNSRPELPALGHELLRFRVGWA